ncbi:MAG: HAD hydrolase-like protein, partial [Myxococcota bacterium]|nr:HAD hydrolase-like protein [Myxococcota bacterium]
LHGVPNATDGLRLAGGTDRALARQMLRRSGLADDEPAIDRVLATYVALLEDVLAQRRYRPIGDVHGTVGVLRARGIDVGVATGNVRAGARLKLASAGLATAFDPAKGAYGCDAESRAEIVLLAATRCASGDEVEVVVVGDTEHDVTAGRAVGARVVGVATDGTSRAELERAGADAIVDCCGDDLLRAILD